MEKRFWSRENRKAAHPIDTDGPVLLVNPQGLPEAGHLG
jgi:hypothetical protein